MRRITADLDYGKGRAGYYLNKAFLTKKFNWYSIEIRKSPSHKIKGKGYHLIIWFKGEVPKMKLRKIYGDDKNRLKLDRRHRNNKQFLFIKKTKTTLKKEGLTFPNT